MTTRLLPGWDESQGPTDKEFKAQCKSELDAYTRQIAALKRRFYGIGEYAGESYSITRTDQNIELYDKPYRSPKLEIHPHYNPNPKRMAE